MNLPDLEVLKRGDDIPWEQVYNALIPHAIAVAHDKLGQSLQMLEKDIAHIAFQKLFERRKRLKSTSELKPLLVVIAYNRSCSLLRYHLAAKRPDGKIIPPPTESLTHFIENTLKAPDTHKEVADQEAMAKVISQLVDGLSDKLKAVLIASFLEERTDKEIAASLGLASSSIPVMRKRGLEDMRAALFKDSNLLSEARDLLRLCMWMIAL